MLQAIDDWAHPFRGRPQRRYLLWQYSRWTSRLMELVDMETAKSGDFSPANRRPWQSATRPGGLGMLLPLAQRELTRCLSLFPNLWGRPNEGCAPPPQALV